MIQVKRAYDLPSKHDGARILVDRLWPRGCTKEALALDAWMKAVTPSPGLRKAFHSGALDFKAFSDRYRKELASPEVMEGLDELGPWREREPSLSSRRTNPKSRTTPSSSKRSSKRA